MNQAPSISIVLPTYNRAAALRDTLPDLLKVRGVSEIVVVDDGSSDDTLSFLAQTRDGRLRVVEHGTRRGLPAARNTGMESASGEWIMYGEDDCFFPADYALALHADAVRYDADIVSAPWLHVPADARESALATARSKPLTHFTLGSHPGAFPPEPTRTPFLQARALIHRRVFEEVRFFEGLRGNAYREETDFFVSATRHGFVCLLSPATASFQALQSSGGARSGRLRYEYWTLRNNWVFLRRHRQWLRANGHVRSPVVSELRFAFERVSPLIRHRLRALKRAGT
jgi:GT2 family glycosyltransferase